MALLDTPAEVGPNSFEMLPFTDQEFEDFCTGEILISAIKASSDYSCTGRAEQLATGLGPLVQAEISESQALTQVYTAAQTAAAQDTVVESSAPIITDQEIADAPDAVPLGSNNASLSPFSATDIAAAQRHPVNWSESLTIQATMRRTEATRQRQDQERVRGPLRAPRYTGNTPRPQWGGPAAASANWCGGNQAPWGKLLLFGGLGLLAIGMMQRK